MGNIVGKERIMAAMDIAKEFTPAEWREFFMTSRKYQRMDLPEYQNPISTYNDACDLHKRMVQLCIDFINERNLTDIDEVNFGADGLQSSAKCGEWSPSTDSSLSLVGIQEEEGIRFPVRKIITESL